MNSRRNFLKNFAAGSGAAAALAAFPPSIRRALAIPANNATGTINDVEHVVILMQENRSFDHYFGTMRGVRGFGDRHPIPLPRNRTVWQQSVDNAGTVVMPYHLDSRKGNAQRVNGTPHTWVDGQAAWDSGRMSQWPSVKKTHSMGYYKEAELPFQFALANAFTICDAYHCSMHTGTTCNRLFHWTGSNGATSGLAVVNNEWYDLGPSTAGHEWKTYAERLEEAGINWFVYQNMPDNFHNNPLGGFKNFRRANEAATNPVVVGAANQPYDPVENAKNPLFKGIANTMPDGGFFAALREDVLNNTLPQVSWVIHPATYSEHPGPSSPVQGAWYIQQLLDALTANPEVWSKTALIVNFDENDGYFDHMPSPSAPSLNPDGSSAGKTTLPESALAPERYTQPNPTGTNLQPAQDSKVFGPGIRVPMYVISPWSKGGWVSSEVFDHTSVLRFLEKRFGVMEPNISAYRRAVCGDLTSAFNFATPNDPSVPELAGRISKQEADDLRQAQSLFAQVPLPVDPQLPRQATGTRPSRATPYELHVSARTDPAAGTVKLLFSNTGSAAAVFHVYDKLHLDRIPRRYMVEAGKLLDDDWSALRDDLGRYDLWVLGPNGFMRHFSGDLTPLRAPGAANPELRVCYDVAKGNVYLKMLNAGAKACTFTIQPQAYRSDGPWTAAVAGGSSAEEHWDLSNSGCWYDFSVTTDADPTYFRRFAGRVETGKDAISDPAMGLPLD